MNEALWTRVQTALDERREVDWPHELGDLRAAIEALERADNPLRAPRRIRPVPTAAAALALVGLGTWFAFPSRTAAEELELHPVVATPALECVRSWTVVSTSETSEGAQTVRASQGRIEFENDYRAAIGTLAQAIVLVTKEESWSLQ